MLQRFVPSGKSLKTLAVAGAWFFIVVSLGHLAWAVGHKWSDPAGTFKLYHTIVDGHSFDAWGLTYSGTLGLLNIRIRDCDQLRCRILPNALRSKGANGSRSYDPELDGHGANPPIGSGQSSTTCVAKTSRYCSHLG